MEPAAKYRRGRSVAAVLLQVVLDFLERVSDSTEMAEVVVAAGIAREELLGLGREPYPD
jgi:hypothetical protein